MRHFHFRTLVQLLEPVKTTSWNLTQLASLCANLFIFKLKNYMIILLLSPLRQDRLSYNFLFFFANQESITISYSFGSYNKCCKRIHISIYQFAQLQVSQVFHTFTEQRKPQSVCPDAYRSMHSFVISLVWETPTMADVVNSAYWIF
jgi:hypothetical protein